MPYISQDLSQMVKSGPGPLVAGPGTAAGSVRQLLYSSTETDGHGSGTVSNLTMTRDLVANCPRLGRRRAQADASLGPESRWPPSGCHWHWHRDRHGACVAGPARRLGHGRDRRRHGNSVTITSYCTLSLRRLAGPGRPEFPGWLCLGRRGPET
jgi:hypothetical protein